MELSLNHIGSYGGNPSKIIELKIEGYFGTIITEDVTNLKSEVSEKLIFNLREIADELEEQNLKLLSNQQEQTLNK